MGYRQHFDPPAFIRGPHTTQDWLNWMIRENVLHEVALWPERPCGMCGGSVGMMYDGQPFPRCLVYHSYGNVIDGFVPASYSLDVGLESMLHMYKDWPGYGWLRLPLGSLFYARSSVHRACIERKFGAIDVAVPVQILQPGQLRRQCSFASIKSAICPAIALICPSAATNRAS